MENEAFMEWRRNLAMIEEKNPNVMLTPYEKNLDVWKQLWRVIEKCDVLVQIVDGRDPLFFRCTDLETYTKEIDPSKQNVLLINKSDLLGQDIRDAWSKYFTAKNIKHIFFSAKIEQEKIDEIISES
jgi:large subunit GTPase 1